jgi:hypothetical protein
LAGTFQSYNFNNGADTMIEKQLYSVCFRQAEGKRSSGNDVTQNYSTITKTLLVKVNTDVYLAKSNHFMMLTIIGFTHLREMS